MECSLEHFSHTIATFSELGIALSLVVFTDLPKWRVRLRANGDEVNKQTLLSAAKDAGWPYHFIFMVVTWMSGWLWYFVPFISAIMGYLALHFLAKSCSISFFSYPIEIGERAVLYLAVWSFWLSSITNIVVSVAAASAAKAEILKKSI